MAAYTAGWMTYGHLQADCLYTGISSGPNARYRLWEAFTFLRIFATIVRKTVIVMAKCGTAVSEIALKTSAIDEMNLKSKQGDQSGAILFDRPCS